ncbi:MAG: CHAT domain-containing protein [Bacteroidia bacterium]|nr:CHAT domain-containing protein [Bacteroidia bacterium]MDW8236079.1 CHAT domain-containing tetratricopeptide repeat protein [Bacteroidia bacterium]
MRRGYLAGLLWVIVGWAQEELLREAEIYQQQRRYSQALAAYESVLRHAHATDIQKLQAYVGGATCLRYLQDLPQWGKWLSEGKRLAQSLRDTLSQAQLLTLEGEYHRMRRDFSAAVQAHQQAALLYEKKEGKQSLSYAHALHRLGNSHFLAGSYGEAEKCLTETSLLYNRLLEKNHPDRAILSRDMARVYTAQGRHKEAEKIYADLRKAMERSEGGSAVDYGLLLRDIAKFYEAQGKNPEAEGAYAEARAYLLRSLGPTHPAYLQLLRDMGDFYRKQRKMPQVEHTYQEMRQVAEKLFGKISPDYVDALHEIAQIRVERGYYREAERLYRETRRVLPNLYGNDHPAMALCLNNLATVLHKQGRYAEAEPLYLQAAHIYEKQVGEEHPEYLSTMTNLAALYAEMGIYPQAERIYNQVLTVREKRAEKQTVSYTILLGNIANLYQLQKRYLEAERLYKEALALKERLLGKEHVDYVATLQNLALLYQAQRQYKLAESLLLQAVSLYRKLQGERSRDLVVTAGNLAACYRLQEKHGSADSLYREVFRLAKTNLGEEHPYYLGLIGGLCQLRVGQRRFREADSLWKEGIARAFRRIRREFGILPQVYREQLVENTLLPYFTDFERYVALYRKEVPEMVELGYRVARSMKGLVLSSAEGVRYWIEASKDSMFLRLYHEWRELGEEYAFFLLQGKTEASDSVWQRAVAIERKILEKLPSIEDFLPNPEVEATFPPLRPEEMVVEVLRVEVGDSILYLYYLLYPEKHHPRLTLQILPVNTRWEKQMQQAYAILCYQPTSRPTGVSYEGMWKFIDTLIPVHVKRVYFAPDGIYYKVNIVSLYDVVRKGYVLDRYQVQYVATSRRLLRRKVGVQSGKAAVIGGPNFYGVDTVFLQLAKIERLFPQGIPVLPGAKAEAIAIAKLIGVSPITDDQANEAYLKRLRAPEVLHIATHGYYYEGTGSPLVRGGLLLAQAAVWDSIFVDLDIEDGKLTAQEAATMNLQGTQLVVLSACESGLGEIKGEGLYGLQRAFLEAGAVCVISALWRIDDAATQELMRNFYQYWWPRRAQVSVAQAFHEVIQAFRKEYPHVYYWGAFILMQ